MDFQILWLYTNLLQIFLKLIQSPLAINDTVFVSCFHSFLMLSQGFSYGPLEVARENLDQPNEHRVKQI